MSNDHSRRKLPVAVRVSGWLAIAGAIPLAARLVWEQTFLTRSSGPQMVGFSLVHIHGDLFVTGLFFALCLHIWLFAFTALWLYELAHRSGVSRVDWAQAISALIVAGSLWVPYGVWQFATTELTGAGPEGAKQLTYAAMNNQQYLVKALLRSGVAVNAPGAEGRTALDSACGAKQIELARYLISKGAILDQVPDCRSVSEFAARMKPVQPAIVPKSNRPQLPGTTIDVTAEAPGGWPPAPKTK